MFATINGRGKFMVECGCDKSLVDPCSWWWRDWFEELDEVFETIDGRGKFMVECECGISLIDPCPRWGCDCLEESEWHGCCKFMVECGCGKFLIDSSPNGSEDVSMRSGVAWGLSGVSKCS